MASSSKPRKTYHVFLSFRGEDVRKNFVSHLHNALVREGIYTFFDNEELENLRKGDEIAPTLMKAIEESCIAIIVFSKHYASSPWCLEELAKIMECKEPKGLVALPVFYKVDPSNVRRVTESYKHDLDMLASTPWNDSEKVLKWRRALFDAGNLSGWHLKDEDESKLIEKIVEDISTRLSRTPLAVTEHLIGLDSRVAKLKSMLNLDSNNDVVRVGLWGQGGIGKTTLAKALYNSVFRQFGGSCFLENVRGGDLVTLQEKLLKENLKGRLEVSSVSKGTELIEERLGCKTVLLILDDVDDLEQFRALGGQVGFHDGSKIVVTTRDKQLLTCCKIDQYHVYGVELLGDSEALELLCGHAFRTQPRTKISEDLVQDVVNYAEGLPLALEVLGSFLYDKEEEMWRSTLKDLSLSPHDRINAVLKRSYEGLGENWQKIFLHIVCFFKGSESEHVKKVLDNCDLPAKAGLEVLIDRALINIDKNGLIKVHDLIQAMGINIVNRNDDPGKRTRLWMYDDVIHVLQSDTGDCAVEAIVLELPQSTKMWFGPEAFTKKRMLRLLIMRNVHNPYHGPIFLPITLRWIELDKCGWTPKFSFSPKELDGFGIRKRSIRGDVKHFKEFRKLKYLKLDGCDSLVNTPDISCTPNLEELIFSECKSLEGAHKSITRHDKLQVISFDQCPELRVFPKVLESKSLQELKLQYCPKFERFPNIPHKLNGLKQLHLCGLAIKQLPASIEKLVSLEKMCIIDCKNLVSLPSNIYKLENLQYFSFCLHAIEFPKHQDSADLCTNSRLPKLIFLELVHCKLSEVEFLEDLSCFPLLRELNLQSTDITSLPTSISMRTSLSKLDLSECYELQEIPELPPFLKYLSADACQSLQTEGHLTSIDMWVKKASRAQDFPSLIHLYEEQMPEWFENVKEDSLSFMASKDLYDKFLGLVFCAVRDRDGLGFNLGFTAYFNGQSWYDSTDPEVRPAHGISLAYFPPSHVWKVVDFGQVSGKYARFSLTLSSSWVEEHGCRIICKKLGKRLKAEIQDNQLIDLSLLHEIRLNKLRSPELRRAEGQSD